MPGPVPKRSDQRRRVNKPEIEVEHAPAAETVEIPLPGDDWHDAAIAWFESLTESGQAEWYEPSDWATAWVWAELLSRALKQGARPSAQLIVAWASGATELLTTEGARRRLRIELERGQQGDPAADAAVTALDAFRRRATG